MTGRLAEVRAFVRDPRSYQIAALGTLLVVGIAKFDLDVGWSQVTIILMSALAAQGLLAVPRRRLHGGSAGSMGRPVPTAALTSPPPFVAAFEWRSALISGLSLCLLLRARHSAWLALAALLAVGCKFALRVPRADGTGTKHVLNPTNGAIVLLLLGGAPVWVSPAQWGHHLPLALGVAGFGSLVVHRSARSDVTLAFLAAWAAVLFGRAALVGQPWVAPLHQIENGSVALFAFHMISDPRTTPDSRAGRIVFACLVALGAGLVQYGLHRTNGLLWSLAACSLFIPLIDRALPGRGFEWSAPGTGTHKPKGVRHASSRPAVALPVAGVVRGA